MFKNWEIDWRISLILASFLCLGIALLIKLIDPVKNGSCRFAHADKNRFMDVIITAGTKVVAFDLAGNRLFAYDMPVDVDYAGTFERPGGRGVYAFGRQHRTLCLSDNGGSRVTTYPASSPPLQTDLFSNKQRYLVFGENNLLHCLAFR